MPKRLRTNPDGSRRNGQPPLLTPELQRKIVDLVTAGNFPVVAGQYHGVGERTIQEWMSRGENPDHPRNIASGEDTGIYVEFARAIREAEAKSQVRAVTVVMRAALDGDLAAIKFLERRFRRLWGVAVQMTGEGGGPIQVETLASSLDDHEKAILRDLINTELAKREEVEA